MFALLDNHWPCAKTQSFEISTFLSHKPGEFFRRVQLEQFIVFEMTTAMHDDHENVIQAQGNSTLAMLFA